MVNAKPSRQSSGAEKLANSTFDTIRKVIVTRDKVGLCNTEVVKIPGYATIGILSTGMESLPETGHGKIGGSVKKSYRHVKCNGTLIQRFRGIASFPWALVQGS